VAAGGYFDAYYYAIRGLGGDGRPDPAALRGLLLG
jgi:hypothetical protein